MEDNISDSWAGDLSELHDAQMDSDSNAEIHHADGIFETSPTENLVLLPLPRPFVNPPWEILREIFGYAVAPVGLLDPSPVAGPFSPWMANIRCKRSLVLVCKAWWQAGIKFLYEEVVFHQIGQLSAFHKTLREHLNFGTMVKRLWVICSIPLAYHKMLNEVLPIVVTLCPRLTRLGLHINADFYEEVEFWRRARPVLSDVRQIDFGPQVTLDVLIPQLTSFTSLVSLTLNFASISRTPKKIHLHLNLPSLEELYISSRVDSTPMLQCITKWFLLPRLTRLTVDQILAEQIIVLPFIPLFQKFGTRLRYLSVRIGEVKSGYLPTLATKDIQTFLNWCPELEHFVIATLEQSFAGLKHQRLQWIDVWQQTRTMDEADRRQALLQRIYRQDLPALRGVRILDYALIALIGLPRIIPPDTTVGTWQYPGMHIKAEPGYLYRCDLQYYERHFDGLWALRNGSGETFDDGDDEYTGSPSSHEGSENDSDWPDFEANEEELEYTSRAMRDWKVASEEAYQIHKRLNDGN